MKTIRDLNKQVFLKLPNGWDENNRPNPKIIASGTITRANPASNTYTVKLRKQYKSLPLIVYAYPEQFVI